MNLKENRLHVPGSEKMTTDQENPPPKKPGPIGLDARYYTIFFDAHGSVAQICLPKGQRVTGEYSQANKKYFCLLAQIVGAFLWYIGVAESENTISFAELALVF